ncbi:hypothetical protein [Kitasatospora sp. NPDC088134]|uniref:terpene synthase family protein n=1 Tax=Kitasatospora sp. NPDC088134 TaxID=3364071 RepID=UPI0038247FD4
MPQTLALDMPFTPRLSPDVDRCRDRHRRWLLGHGLLRSPQAVAEYMSWDIARSMGRSYPLAVGTELDLVTDTIGMFFLFDDQFYAPDDRPGERAPSVVDELIAICDRPLFAPPELVNPLTRGWSELWGRICVGMSGAWRARNKRHWAAHFRACQAEEANRRRGTVLSVEEYIAFRRDAVGMRPSIDLIERVGHYELPSRIQELPEILDLRDACTDSTSLANDLHSVEREESRGDTHNLVLVIEHERGCGRQESLEVGRDIVNRRVRDFVRLRESLPALAVGEGLGSQDTLNLLRFAEGMADWIRGNYDWGNETARYSQDVPVPAPGEAGYLEDLIGTTC